MSTESLVRRGGINGVGATSACTSTKSGRVPSTVGIITLPMSSSLSGKNNLDASGTSARPESRISNRPISLVAPKRFLIALKTLRSAVCSPSKNKTVSTICSRTRGPARFPSFVTCPIIKVAMPLALEIRIKPAAHSRICDTDPGALSILSLKRV